jgi:signal-transduction protein with cAMP-binding, CBS, and nucleotidyltransferase domain
MRAFSQKELAMKTAQDIINEKQRAIISMPAETTVHDAIKTMVQEKIGVMLVTVKDQIAGIWSRRDLLQNTITPGFNPRIDCLRDYMRKDLQYAPASDTVFNLMDKFLGLRVCHLLVTKSGETIGLLSMGDVMKASIQEKNEELKSLQAIISWDYYEEWEWRPDRKT